MGADIHSFAEVRRNNKWEKVEEALFDSYGDTKTGEPFGNRDYSVFGFLANVRNYSHCEPICENKGLPDDSEYLNSPSEYDYGFGYSLIVYKSNKTIKNDLLEDYNLHSHSWLSLKELLDFDYDKTFWDRRITKTTYHPGGVSVTNGAALAQEGEGEIITYRQHLGQEFFNDIEVLKTLGDPDDVRVIFLFDI